MIKAWLLRKAMDFVLRNGVPIELGKNVYFRGMSFTVKCVAMEYDRYDARIEIRGGSKDE